MEKIMNRLIRNLEKYFIANPLLELIRVAKKRKPKDYNDTQAILVSDPLGKPHYKNFNSKLNINFSVDKLPFTNLEILDPRIVTIAPNSKNELHRHAHESIFVILSGNGKVRIGSTEYSVKKGQIAFVPRWQVHQTSNTSSESPLVILAIADFGFTSTILGNYDKRTRLAENGDQANQKQLGLIQ